jgi:glycosyltransferase involved in cell wall biosynthesis
VNTDRTAPGRLRVLLLVTAREEGGAERVAEELVRALRARCDFTVVVPTGALHAFAARLSEHARVVPLPLDRAGGLWAAAAGVRRLARNADVVHLNSNHPASRLAAVLALAIGRAAPLVSVEQQASSPSAVSLPAFFEPWAGLAFRLSRRHAAVVVAVSDENARRLSGEYRIDASRIVTVRNGIDPASFDIPAAQRLARRRELGIADDEQVVMVPARQAPNKGHRLLVLASSRVLADRPRTRFVLAGARHPMVAEFIRRHGVEPSFLDLGLLPHTEMVRTIGAADVVALPSFAEGFSVALLEGMAAGAIPVATTVGGAAELITDGHDGFLVPPGEVEPLAAALTRALTLDPPARSAMSARARARAGTFSIDATAAGTFDAYRRAIASEADPNGASGIDRT